VYPAAEVLLGNVDPGQNPVIVGGGLVGCELALWLASKGKKVTIVEAEGKILALNGPLCHANSEMLERLVPFRGIEVLTSSKVESATATTVTIAHDGKKTERTADSGILAVGYAPETALYQTVKNQVSDLHLIGDARKVSNIMYAIGDAFEVASSL